MKASEHTRRSQTSLRVARGSMQRVVRWLARLVDEQPDWFKALLAVVSIYLAVRGTLDMCAMLVWLSIRLAI